MAELTERLIEEGVRLAGPADVPIAAEAAAAAQESWGRVSAEYRAGVLHRSAAVLESSRDEITAWLTREAGAVRATASAEVDMAVRTCRHAAALALAPSGEVLRSERPRLSLARRLPVGVVGVITPFNLPLAMAVRAVAPALALGNAVLLKPDPRTAVTGGVAVARVFERAGLPRGLLRVLPGGPDIGRAVVSDPRIPVVSFTGSTATGRRVAELAGRLLKRVVLELGGNGALLVLDDSDLDRAIPVAAHASFLHQGQVCIAARRHLVHESLHEEYVARLGEYAESLTVGPLIDADQRDRVHQVVSASIAAGATLVAGGRYDGLAYRPTVLAEPTEPSPAATDEVFGPVATVRSFATVTEAAELVADAGLAVAILTGDVARGMALADRLPVGMVHVNDPTTDYEPQAPFGGFAPSGNGWRIGGGADLDTYTETQWLTVSAAPAGWRL